MKCFKNPHQSELSCCRFGYVPKETYACCTENRTQFRQCKCEYQSPYPSNSLVIRNYCEQVSIWIWWIWCQNINIIKTCRQKSSFILHLTLQNLTRLPDCVCVAINKNVDLAMTPAQRMTVKTKINVKSFSSCLNVSKRLVSTAEPPVWGGGGSWNESHSLSFVWVRELQKIYEIVVVTVALFRRL